MAACAGTANVSDSSAQQSESKLGWAICMAYTQNRCFAKDARSIRQPEKIERNSRSDFRPLILISGGFDGAVLAGDQLPMQGCAWLYVDGFVHDIAAHFTALE